MDQQVDPPNIHLVLIILEVMVEVLMDLMAQQVVNVIMEQVAHKENQEFA